MLSVDEHIIAYSCMHSSSATHSPRSPTAPHSIPKCSKHGCPLSVAEAVA